MSFFTAEYLSPLFTHEDFKELKSPYTVPLIARLVERLNRKRDAELERLREENEMLRGKMIPAHLAPTSILAMRDENVRLREALEFYADPFTWARVNADSLHMGALREFDFNGMYGKKAREALADIIPK